MKKAVSRSIVLVAALAALPAGGLFGMYATDAGPFDDPIEVTEEVSDEPLVCRQLDDYTDLPEFKLEALRLECEQARDIRKSPARTLPPVPTPVPGGAQPLPPCDQWDPSIAPAGCRHYGILEGRQPPPGYDKRLLVSNSWAGEQILVVAGSLSNDSSQGIVVATERDTGSPLGEFLTPAKEGALRIVSEEGSLLHLTSLGGGQFTFDVNSMALAEK